jgi:hypothetical protein
LEQIYRDRPKVADADNRPFEWFDSDRSIVFHGLAAGDRGEYRTYY